MGVLNVIAEINTNLYGLVSLHSGGTISGSTSLSSYPPSKAFDDVVPVLGSTSGRWLARIDQESPAWVQYRFPGGEKYIVGRYTIWNSTYSGVAARAPKDFVLSGSSNGTDWVTLDTRTNETGWAEAEDRTYFIANPTTAYEYYKLSVSANNGDNQYMGISELELFEPPDLPPASPMYISPTNGAVDVSINGSLSWNSDVVTVSNLVYLGTNPILTEVDLLGTTVGQAIEYSGLNSSSIYYWMVVSVNANGASTGEVYQFTTFIELPEQIAYEGFESYATGALDGAGAAGDGWTAPWFAATSLVQIVSDSMSYSGGQVYVNGGGKAVKYTQISISPLLQRDIIPVGYGPAYMSLLVKGQGMQNDVNSFVLRDMDYTGGPDGIPHSLGMNFARANSDTPPGYIDAEVYGATSRVREFTYVAPTNDVTYFVVVRLTRSANNQYETAEVIVNPTTLTEPTTGWTSANYPACEAMTLSAFAVRAAVMDAGDWITFDEIRIGTTYESVVPGKLTGTIIQIL
jgi:hypothetical protein